MAFTPLLDLYLGALLNVPSHIIEATRPAMKIMILWGAFIGYRRFHQGIIIRAGKTRYVAAGTAHTGASFRQRGSGAGRDHYDCRRSRWGYRPDVFDGGGDALHLYHLATRCQTLAIDAARDGHGAPLGKRDALRFHLPLAATSVDHNFGEPGH